MENESHGTFLLNFALSEWTREYAMGRLGVLLTVFRYLVEGGEWSHSLAL